MPQNNTNNNNNFITTIKTEPLGSPKSIISLINTAKVINTASPGVLPPPPHQQQQQQQQQQQIIVNNSNLLNLNENSNKIIEIFSKI
jgi:hypothetical protein